MNEMAFETLHGYRCALVDATSISLISGSHIFPQLSEPLELPSHLASRAETLVQAFCKQYRTELSVLARLVAYDFVVVEATATESRGIESVFSDDIIRRVHVPDQIYADAADEVIRQCSRHRNGWMQNDEWFDGCWKAQADEIFRRRVGLGWIANSEQSIPRAFFYLEVAQRAGVPSVLSPGKHELLQHIVGRVKPDALREIQNTADSGIRHTVEASFDAQAYVAEQFEIPPLEEYIVRYALRHGTSLFDSVIELRGAPGANEFRALVHRLSRTLMQGGRANILAARQLLAPLGEASMQWGQSMNVNVGTKYVARTIRLESIPVIGKLLKSFGMSEIDVRDPVLFDGPRYVNYVADWYRQNQGGG